MDEQNHLMPEVEPEETPEQHVAQGRRKNRQRTLIFAMILVVAILMSSLFTFSVTYRNLQSRYAGDIGANADEYAALQAQVESLTQQLEEAKKQAELTSSGTTVFPQLELLHRLFQFYSYYAGDVSQKELEVAVMKAYAEATGDRYAEYFTEEEYQEIVADNAGNFEGIGVSVLNETLEVKGVKYSVYQVLTIYETSHAWDAGLAIGDYIYAIKDGENYQSIDGLGGYTKAITKIRGAKGTYSEILVFRKSDETYESIELSILRDAFEAKSVTYKVSDDDSKVGIIRISEFDQTTPGQLKEAVSALQKTGVSKFVFDLRNNPGGDLRSIRATLSYFLNKGDLILTAMDRSGVAKESFTVGVMSATASSGSCTVTESEIGMYQNLSMVVLCNENTASAAEVFVASMQDYGLAKVVGTVTYGKGIIQTTWPISIFGSQYSGYVKMTTHAYVTRRGVTYHEIGITPDVEVALTEEAASYSIYLRPESVDNQLQTAISQLK